MDNGIELSPRVALVCFAFGVALVRPGDELAGPVLMRLLGDLGLSAAASRSLLLRMRREGLLSSGRKGREARYRLAPVIYAAQARVESQLRGQRPSWPGSFHGVLYEVPERARAYRDRLRRTAQLLGYVTLRPGLLLATTDRWDELVSLLPAQAPGSQLLQTRVTFSMPDSRRVAEELWDLKSLAARYRTVLGDARARIEQAERRPPAAAVALRAFSATMLPLYEVSGHDPDLPAELLPAGWPGDELSALFTRAFRVFSSSLGDYIASLKSGR